MKKAHPRPITANFYWHLSRNIAFGLIFIAIALLIGVLGYHYYEDMSWADAFVNASMILSGMGPVTLLTSNASKIFAGCYALFSGLVFIAVIAIIFSPIIHRIVHKIHLEGEKGN